MSIYIADTVTGKVTAYDSTGAVVAVSPAAPLAQSGYGLAPPPVSAARDTAGNFYVALASGSPAAGSGTTPGSPVPLWGVLAADLSAWTLGPAINPSVIGSVGYVNGGLAIVGGQLWINMTTATSAYNIPVDAATGALGTPVAQGNPASQSLLAAGATILYYLEQSGPPGGFSPPDVRQVSGGVDSLVSNSWAGNGSIGSIAVDAIGMIWVTAQDNTVPDPITLFAIDPSGLQEQVFANYPASGQMPDPNTTGVFAGGAWYFAAGSGLHLAVWRVTPNETDPNNITVAFDNPLFTFTGDTGSYLVGADASATVAPPLRQYPRSDSLGMGGSSRARIASNTMQSTARQGWRGVVR